MKKIKKEIIKKKLTKRNKNFRKNSDDSNFDKNDLDLIDSIKFESMQKLYNKEIVLYLNNNFLAAGNYKIAWNNFKNKNDHFIIEDPDFLYNFTQSNSITEIDEDMAINLLYNDSRPSNESNDIIIYSFNIIDILLRGSGLYFGQKENGLDWYDLFFKGKKLYNGDSNGGYSLIKENLIKKLKDNKIIIINLRNVTRFVEENPEKLLKFKK